MNDPLFQPFTTGSLSLRNRIVMSPMGQGKAPGGKPDAGYVDYFRQRAEGETGLIISGTTAIDHPQAPFDENEPHLHGAALAIWQEIITAVHASGGRMIPQLGHAGLQGLAPAPPPWLGLGPSGMWMKGAQIGSEPVGDMREPPMTLAQIDEVISAFVRAAETAKALGFDGIEIHGAHGFLIDQFLWSHTNQRADAYGAQRGRFAAEIVSACRATVGPDLPILFRFSQFKMTDYAARLADTPADLEAVLRPLVDAGVTMFDCSQRRFWRPEFKGSPLNLAGWVKKLSGRPTIGGGGVGLEKTSLEYGEAGVYAHVACASTGHLDELRDRLDRGEFDLISVGRAILGDPEWARKVRTGATHTLQPYRPEVLVW
jgi:2,4-dienoyl-CoA reductase-like NADH-dependent reductase (Old Yellow Enzyme family)